MDARSDDALLSAARAGDSAALEALLRRYQPQVYRFGRRMCGDQEHAEDVLQETLLAAARGVREFRGDAAVSTWLYSITRSFCLKQRRKRRRDQALQSSSSEDDGRWAHAGPTPDDNLQQRELRSLVGRALERLPAEQREVLVLRDVEGLTAPEVASSLNLTVQAVKSRLHRARARLREEVASQAPSPPAESAPERLCTQIVDLFSEHREGDVGPEQCRTMRAHLERCPRCRQVCDSLEQVLSVCSTWRDDAPVAAAAQSALRQAIDAFLEKNR